MSELIKCSCGHHKGNAAYNAYEYAAIAARMRDTMQNVMSDYMLNWLISFEKWHGRVAYSMGAIGINSGEFDKSKKGQPLQGAIYDYRSDKYISRQ